MHGKNEFECIGFLYMYSPHSFFWPVSLQSPKLNFVIRTSEALSTFSVSLLCFYVLFIGKRREVKGKKNKETSKQTNEKTQQISEQIKYSAVEPDRFFLFELTMIHPQSCST